jgi:hypothetical protein
MKVAKEGNIDFLRLFFSLRQKMRAAATICDDGLDDDSCEYRYRAAPCIAGHGFLRNFSDKAMRDLNHGRETGLFDEAITVCNMHHSQCGPATARSAYL